MKASTRLAGGDSSGLLRSVSINDFGPSSLRVETGLSGWVITSLASLKGGGISERLFLANRELTTRLEDLPCRSGLQAGSRVECGGGRQVEGGGRGGDRGGSSQEERV